MGKEIFHKSYSEKIEKNYAFLEPYFEDNLIMLSAINLVKYEIINCLMIEQNIAAINCTNHFVERLMKLSLIMKETENLKIDQTEQLSDKLDIAYGKFDKLTLSESIEESYKSELINESEFNDLSHIRKEIRNSYGHAEMEKINNGKKDKIEMFSFDINQVKEAIINGNLIDKKKIDVSTKSPSIQSEIQRMKSAELAMPYFKSVYKIAKNIDVRLDVKKEYYK